MGELLGAFAYASDLAFGLDWEDSLRTCYMAARIAGQMDAPAEERLAVYYTALLKDAGCTSWTSELARVWQTDEILARRDLIIFTDMSTAAGLEAWMRRHVAPHLAGSAREQKLSELMAAMPEVIAEAIANTAEVAGRIAERLGMPEPIRKGLRHIFEQWDGKGAPDALPGPEIPLASRIVLVAFIAVPIHRYHGREAALEAINSGDGSVFDPAVVAALKALSQDEKFWSGMEGQDIRERVLMMEPASALAEVDESRVEDIAVAFADFIDLKSRFAAAHSRRVAGIAEQIARLLACAPEAIVQIRRAALMHDLGLVAVPSFFLEKPEAALSGSEWEQYRLHPYHGERILRLIPVLEPMAEIVGNHQERFDGTGYYRGLRGSNINLGSRIIAVADRLDELTHEAPERPALSPEAAIKELAHDPGLDPEIVRALANTLNATPERLVHQWPAGLTDREVDVLRLAAKGLTRAQVAFELQITESTVRHHLEHIYGKTGTTTRVGATLFAIENGLIE
jgi:HD-GYP domain-containing protein (c-di-GMP phosphodiesterase class II)